jgi:hypothetical protein
VRYKITAAVDGRIVIRSARVSCEREGLTFELNANPDGKVISASVTCVVPNDKLHKFAGTMVPAGSGGPVKFNVQIGGDSELHDRLVAALQDLESALGHTEHGAAVRHIRWDEAENEYIPETDEERDFVGILGFSYGRRRPDHVVVMPDDIFRGVVQVAIPRYRDLNYTMSLWREGVVRFEDGQYLDALHYLFLAFEDLFAAGYTGKKQALQAFRSNPLCRRVVEAALRLQGWRPEDQKALRKMFEDGAFDWSVDGAIEFFYSKRGQLSHAATRRRGFKDSMLRQSEFRPLALFAVYVVNYALLLKKVELNEAVTVRPQT